MKKTLVIFAAIALVFGFAATTMAADWNFYGHSRMTTFYSTFDQKAPSGGMFAQGKSDTDVTWALQGNSRIGATVSNGDVGGGFEYGTGVNVRKLYGTWNFGSGTLLVGQTYTPITHFITNQVYNGDNGLFNVGEVYAGRQPMLQLTFGGLKIAFISPSVAAAGTYGSPAVDTDVMLPKLEANYNYKTDMWFFDVYGGYETYDMVSSTDDSKSVDAYLLGVDGGMTFGAATIKANLYMGQNLVAYGATSATAGLPTDAAPAGRPVWNGTEFDDDAEYGAVIAFSYKFSDMVGAEAGIGYKKNSLDDAADTEYTNMAYYLQVPITLAPGVFVVPEIGMYDFGDMETNVAKTDRGDLTYFGAKWQINF